MIRTLSLILITLILAAAPSLAEEKTARDYLWEGAAHSADGQHFDAIQDYNKAIALNPDYDFAYVFRGSAKYELGQHVDAIQDLDKAIALDPDDAPAYNNRGNAQVSLGRYQAAITDFNEAIRLNPKYASAYSNRGNTKNSLGRYEAAITDYDKAIALDPEYTAAYSNRGSAKINLGRYEAAITDFDKAIELDPEYTQAYHNRAVSVGKLEAEKTKQQLLEAQEEALAETTQPNRIIELFREEIERSRKRLYGTNPDGHNSNTKNTLEKTAERATKNLRYAIVIIFGGLF